MFQSITLSQVSTLEERLAALEEEYYPDVDFSGASYKITRFDTIYICTLSGAYVPPAVNGQLVTGIRLSGSGGTVDSTISVPLETSDSVTFQFTSESNNTSSLTFMLLSSGDPISGETYVVNGTSRTSIILGYTINEGVSDPYDSVTYIEDNAGWTPMSMSNGTLNAGSWASESAGQTLLDSIKPVVRRSDGTYEDLDKRNPSNLASGGSANLTVGNDFLVYFANTFQWLSITRSGNIVTVKYATEQVDGTYHNYAFLGNDGQAKEGFSIGAVYGQRSDSNLYSSPESALPDNISLTDAINYAANRGATADIATWDMKNYITGLFPLLFKTTNGQAHMWGNNSYGGTMNPNTVLTFTNDYGMNGTTANQTSKMAFLWIHDFWGNSYWYVGGAMTNSSRHLIVQHGARSSIDESDFEDTGIGPEGMFGFSGQITKMYATDTEVGFLPQETKGSITTYYCDYCNVVDSAFPWVGGRYYDHNGQVGPFYVHFYSTDLASNGVRLSFKESEA